MISTINEKFRAELMQEIEENKASNFEPHAFYSASSDSFFFFVRPDAYFGERVDDLLTVFRSRKDGSIIGAIIKGIKLIRKKDPKLMKVIINDSPITS